jgi:hypothetical protein
MIMSPKIRKFVLTLHVITSVGWIGAVTVFLVLAIAGLTGQEAQTVLAAYIAMQLATKLVILPMCLASLVTGIVSSLGTDWGLFRYYWIVVKLLITVICTIGLVVHLQPINYIADLAKTMTISREVYQVQIQLVVISGAALLALFIATVLAIYKPRGMTPYGWRKRNLQK